MTKIHLCKSAKMISGLNKLAPWISICLLLLAVYNIARAKAFCHEINRGYNICGSLRLRAGAPHIVPYAFDA